MPLVMATFPGLLLHGGKFNYHFNYEITAQLTLILWAGILYSLLKSIDDLQLLIKVLGAIVIFVGVMAILDRFGINPVLGRWSPVLRPMSTFGNPNYFAGFLNILLPLFLALSLPGKIETSTGKAVVSKIEFDSENRFFISVLLVGWVALFFTMTRAAIFASMFSFIFVFLAIALTYADKEWLKKVSFFSLGIVALAVLVLALFTSYFHNLNDRVVNSFSGVGWMSRLFSWNTAIASIKSSPIVGYGLGSSHNLFFEFMSPDVRLYSGENDFGNAHSEILEYMQESGIIGLAVLLIFWTYIFIGMVKILRSTTSGLLLKKLAIGIIGCLIAYHVQSLVSLAPRKLAVRIPLFTILAMSVYLINSSATESSRWFGSWNPKYNKALFGFSLISVMSLFVFYYPNAYSSYQYMAIGNKYRSNAERMDKLAEMSEKSKDVFWLYKLSALQVEAGDSKGLEKTIERLDAVFPKFRDVDYAKAELAMMKNQYETARDLTLKFQERDRYYKPGISLLFYLSKKLDDKALFFRQIEIQLKTSAYATKLFNPEQFKNFKVNTGRMDGPFDVGVDSNSVMFTWNEKFVDDLFQVSKGSRDARDFSEAKIDEMHRLLMKLLGQNRYFQIEVKDGFSSDEKQRISEMASRYFVIEAEMKSIKKAIDEEYEIQSMNAGKFQSEIHNRRRIEKMQKVEKEFRDKTDEAISYISKNTNWSEFLTRRRFASEFSSKLAFHIYYIKN
ncbi:MAG: O-antigen ligase family protein [Nitrospinota bacterium]|nr:O-antigen ligase family protein [Nitrospinota bacterium]